VTTSVGEGFGLAFLEPWLSGRPLAGRDLLEITSDFRANGIQLDDLYQRLLVPLEWTDVERLRAAFTNALTANAAAYGRPLSDDALEHAWRSAVDDVHIDLGRLDEPAQETVIRHLRADPGARKELSPSALSATRLPRLIAANDAAIRAKYSLSGYGSRLASIYAQIIDSVPSSRFGHADGDTLLDEFLAPERLTLLRV
jgi:hypothetical protein